MNSNTLKFYKMLKGKVKPDPNSQLIKRYAACSGNIELYNKIRAGWDFNNSNHIACVITGIYKSFEFARWCLIHIDKNQNIIHNAISAKLIMNNDLSYIKDVSTS